MRFEAPKVGKKEGKYVPVDSGLGVVSGADSTVDVSAGAGEAVGDCVVCVGFWFTGRLVASVGVLTSSVFVGVGATLTLVVAAVTSSYVWSSSCSSGRG